MPTILELVQATEERRVARVRVVDDSDRRSGWGRHRCRALRSAHRPDHEPLELALSGIELRVGRIRHAEVDGDVDVVAADSRAQLALRQRLVGSHLSSQLEVGGAVAKSERELGFRVHGVRQHRRTVRRRVRRHRRDDDDALRRKAEERGVRETRRLDEPVDGVVASERNVRRNCDRLLTRHHGRGWTAAQTNRAQGRSQALRARERRCSSAQWGSGGDSDTIAATRVAPVRTRILPRARLV